MNDDKSRTRHRHRICENCGGRYHAVVLVDGETRRECGCFVRVVPTADDSPFSANLEADRFEIRSDSEEVDA